MQSHGGMWLELGRDGQGGSACPRRDGEVTFTHERWLVVSFPLFLQPLSARIIRTWGDFRDEPLQLFRYRGSLDRDRHLAPIWTRRAHHASNARPFPQAVVRLSQCPFFIALPTVA